RNEAGERDQEQERGEQRQEEVVGELRCERETVVREDLARGSFRQRLPAEGDLERPQHQCTPVARRTPVPTVGVHEGASLAGNESADVSCTRSFGAQGPWRSTSWNHWRA